ncbi:hypothetical protein RFI_36311, partial [Reticulomyxa filosa]
QLDDVFEYLNGLKDGNECICALCEKSLETMSTKLNDKQLDRIFSAFIHKLKDTNKQNRESCAKSLGVISTNLTDKQLGGVFNALPKELEYFYFYSYFKALEENSTKWNEGQSERVFNALIFFSKHSINTNNDDYYLVRSLKLISTKLNDKQLYVLVIHLLERAKKGSKRYVINALSKISEDMWKCATICGLKHMQVMKEQNTWQRWFSNVNKKIELLAFGLMTFNPRIQLSCNDDNTNFDALNELIRYCNRQASEWKFPTHQLKWNNSNNDRDIPYPCLNNEIEE